MEWLSESSYQETRDHFGYLTAVRAEHPRFARRERAFRILLAVDGSECARRATEHVVALASDGQAVEVHVINVQSSAGPNPGKGDLIRCGQAASAGSRALLDERGVPFAFHIEVGSAAETILDCAHRAACDLIVLGTRGTALRRRVLIGHCAYILVSLSDVPVTLVK